MLFKQRGRRLRDAQFTRAASLALATAALGIAAPTAQAADTTRPSVSWISPTGGKSVSGSLAICEARASDNVAVRYVEFSVDGTVLNREYSVPYECSWDTRTVANGQHTLTATVVDTSGNTRSASITVTVNNSSPAPTPTPTPTPTGPQLYVSPSGSDSNACTSAAPCRQLTRANALATPGTTVNVAPGSYNGATLSKAGTSSARIRYRSTVKWLAKIVGPTYVEGAYVDFEGFDATLPTGSKYNVIVQVHGNYSRAIGNLIHDLKMGCTSAGSNGGAALLAAGYNHETHHQELIGNVIRDAGTGPRDGTCRLVHGIYVSQPDVLVANNVVFRTIGDGITSWHAATRLTVVNNTVNDSGANGILIGTGDGGATSAGNTNSFVANNVLTNNARAPVGESSDGRRPNSGHVYRNNLSFGNRWVNKLNVSGSHSQSGTVIVDPEFADVAAGDFRLQSGSPGVDTGTSKRAPESDIDGTARAKGVDRGAYER